jgi:hypothetical protein
MPATESRYLDTGPLLKLFTEDTMIRVTTLLSFLAAIALPAAVLGQDAAAEAPLHTIVMADAVTFGPLDVPGFDPGTELAVIYGDPMGASGDYTIRLRFPDGYRFPAHYHPNAENVTVLSGTLLLAWGTDEDPAAFQAYAPGSFINIKPEHPHYGGVTGVTVMQLHGQAPFEIVLANPGS